MKSPRASTILCIAIIFTLLTQALLPMHAEAITIGNKTLDYDNPNKNNKSPYKISFKNVVNGELLTSLVGCTGIVNKVSKVSTEFVQDLLKTKAERAITKAARKTTNTTTKTTTGVALVGEGVSAATPSGPGVLGVAGNPSSSVKDAAIAVGADIVKDLDKNDTTKTQDKGNKLLQENNFREDCLNGIATTLARNQLTAMTKATMNWITTGFSGDPMYVQNVNSFMDSITQQIIKKETDFLKDPKNADQYPFGRDVARMTINSYKTQNNFGAANISDLSKYVVGATSPADATKKFASDFSTGGWDAWLGLTQHPQNNPLGYQINVAQDLTNKTSQEKENTVNELNRNGGYLDQKKCVQYEEPATAIKKTSNNSCKETYEKQYNSIYTSCVNLANVTGKGELALAACKKTYDANKSSILKSCINEVTAPVANQKITQETKCLKYETVTPGSTIKDKITTYVNSPERQLEMAKTINDSLNSLFTALINKFQTQGLTSLGSQKDLDFSNVSGGFGSNSLATILSTGLDQNGDITDQVDSGQPIDITKDLGSMIQLQRDYITAVNTYLKITLGVTPAIGKLDYCIPGPNPNWKANADEITVYVNNTQESRLSKLKPSTYSSSWRSRKKNRARRASKDAEAQQAVLDQLDKEDKVLKARAKDYEAKVTVLYGRKSPMQTETLDNINPNPSYLPMAQVGLNITKDLAVTADNIAEDTETLNTEIADTNGYIYQLNKIKKKVDAIVAAAQKRNDAERKANGEPAISAQCRLKPKILQNILQQNLDTLEAERDRQDKIRTGLNPNITDKMRSDLETFGYTDEQIDAMTALEALTLLDKIYAQHE